MREIKRIFIHCTAGNLKLTKQDLLKEFKVKGWKNPGYHYVVFPDGKVEQLLDLQQVSNGVQGYNSTSINVAYVGGVDIKNKLKPIDNRTLELKKSLDLLLTSLKMHYPNAHIMGHRDIWGKKPINWKKLCPCFDAEAEYAYLDNIKVEKYADAVEDNSPITVPNSPLKPESWINKIKKLAPWTKTY